MISIVIVNWNSGQLLERCIHSASRNAAECQIVIVDNASTDSSLQFASGIKSDILVFRNDHNIGFAAGNNLGWRASSGSHVLFLNPDTECFPGSVQCLEQTLTADKAVWAVAGRLVHPSGKSQTGFNVRAFPTMWSVAAEMLFLDEILPPGRRLRMQRMAGSMAARDVDQPAAACLMVPRTALESIRGFDEAFRPAWFEDVDFCRRIQDHGGRIQYQPEARFLHHGGYSLGRLPRGDFLKIFHTNQIRYFKKHHGLRCASRVKRVILFGLFVRGALSIFCPLAPNLTRRASARAFREAARHLAGLREDTL